MTIFLAIACIILLLALVYACYRVDVYRKACHEWGEEFRGLARDYKALDEGMTELGESMQADILDLHEQRARQNEVNDFLVEDRLLLYRMAARCHENCLPQYHGFTDEELELLARMQDRYGTTDDMDPLGA